MLQYKNINFKPLQVGDASLKALAFYIMKKVCKKCKVEKRLSNFIENKARINGFNHSCKPCEKKTRKEKCEYAKKYRKEYEKENREKINEKNKVWNKANREKLNEYIKNKRITDPLYKLKDNLRRRTRKVFEGNSFNKGSKTEKMLGCSWITVHEHIEKQFTEGMTWELLGKKIHIDHIIPLASARTEEDLEKLCHYTNLQPLWAADNLSKGDKIFA